MVPDKEMCQNSRKGGRTLQYNLSCPIDFPETEFGLDKLWETIRLQLMCCAPSIFVRFNFGVQKKVRRSQTSEQSIQVDIRTAGLQGKLQFKYQKTMAGYGTIRVAECREAMAKCMQFRVIYYIGVRSVAMYGKVVFRSMYNCFIGKAVFVAEIF